MGRYPAFAETLPALVRRYFSLTQDDELARWLGLGKTRTSYPEAGTRTLRPAAAALAPLAAALPPTAGKSRTLSARGKRRSASGVERHNLPAAGVNLAFPP